MIDHKMYQYRYTVVQNTTNNEHPTSKKATNIMVSSGKRLMGVELTPDLQKLLRVVCEDVRSTSSEASGDNNAKTTSSVVASAISPLSHSKAYKMVQDASTKLKESATDDGEPLFLPIAVLRALQTILRANPDLQQQHDPMQPQKLVFRHIAVESTRSAHEQRSYEQRIERLRLQHESQRYSKLTRNIVSNVQDDDITAKSMTYAASIGLNMIIAPISFGVFMYYFGGSLLDFVWPLVTSGRNAAVKQEMRKILLGVVAGVVLLFVELLLFVIRTHALDTAVRKKKTKRTAATPFGHYTSSTSKTYRDR